MNILLILGSAIFLGIFSGKLFHRIRFPQIVGYIILGIILGKSFLHIFEGDVVTSLTPLVNFTLGIIGCVIGSELKASTFRKYGASIYGVLLGEGLLAFAFVTVFVTLLTGKLYLAIILGAIASATDPASTTSVLWEYKAKGPLSRTVTSIVALDDGLALVIYGFVIIFAKAMIVHGHFSLFEGLVLPIWEIAQCLILGGVSGIIVVKAIHYIKEENLVVAFVLGFIAAGVGLSTYLHLDLILSSMAFGATIANVVPKISEKIFTQIRSMTTSLYILFFVVIGAQLDIKVFANFSIASIVVVYLVSRTAGKYVGSYFGGSLTGASAVVKKYTGTCLLTQGTVAMGLAFSISQYLSVLGPLGVETGNMIVSIVAATTFVVQLVGPPMVKWGVTKADEINRNITKEDIVDELFVQDVMKKNFSTINADLHLNEVIKQVKHDESFNYPVVDVNGDLIGIMSIKELKDALLEGELNDIILAQDICVPSRFVLYPHQPLNQAYTFFQNRQLDFLPVLENPESKKVVGLVVYQDVLEILEKKWVERHRIDE